MAYFIARGWGNGMVIVPLRYRIDTDDEVLHWSGDPHRQKTGSPGADHQRYNPKEEETLAGFPNLVSGICQRQANADDAPLPGASRCKDRNGDIVPFAVEFSLPHNLYEGRVCLQRLLTDRVVEDVPLLLGMVTIGCHLAIVELDDGVCDVFLGSHLCDSLLQFDKVIAQDVPLV